MGTETSAGADADALLAAHRYEEARAAYEAALTAAEDPALLVGLAAACRGLDDVPTALTALERAHELYASAGDASAAALAASTLADVQATHLGTAAVARGWLARATRHLRDLPDDPAHVTVEGQLAYLALAYDKDPAVARGHAERSLAHAVHLRDDAAEVLGRAYLGLIDVSLGDVVTGMRLLDEAAASASAGELPTTDELDTYCMLITACARVRDLGRAEQWARHVLSFALEVGSDGFATFARTQWATVLLWRGRWHEADAELERVLAHAAEQPMTAAMALVLRAQLRLRQGRLDEADAELRVAESEPYRRAVRHLVLATRAQLELANGDPEAGADVAERYLRIVPPSDRIERIEVLDVLVRARLDLGDVAAAATAVAELEETAAMLGTDGVRGTALLDRGLLLLAEDDAEGAHAPLEQAVDAFQSAGMPLECGEARVALSRALVALGRTDAAGRQATAARDAAAELGAAALLRVADGMCASLRPARGADGGFTARETEVLRLLAAGRSNAEIAEQLVLSVRTVERHVSNIYLKVGATGPAARTAAVAYARSAGLL